MTVDLIQFSNLNKCNEVSHCFTTKDGGVSNGVFTSLNMGFNRGDDEKNVMKNYEIVAKELNLNIKNFVLSNQVHKDVIKQVTIKDIGKGLFVESDIIEVDGLMTNEKGIALVTFYADCIPLFFYDKINHCVAVSHAGWKGSVLKIGIKTLEAMKQSYGTNPEDVLVGIGPGIGGCCYEVSEDVKKEFDLSFTNDIIAQVVEEKLDKYLIDLKLTNKLALQSIGVPSTQIEISPHCTKCESDRFYSHRVMGANRGSQVGIIALR